MRADDGPARSSDTQCGFKLLDRERERPLFERMVVDGFAFDVELLFLCQRFGLRVEEVPVVWRNAAALEGRPAGRPRQHDVGRGTGALALPAGPVRPRPMSADLTLFAPILDAPAYRELERRCAAGRAAARCRDWSPGPGAGAHAAGRTHRVTLLLVVPDDPALDVTSATCAAFATLVGARPAARGDLSRAGRRSATPGSRPTPRSCASASWPWDGWRGARSTCCSCRCGRCCRWLPSPEELRARCVTLVPGGSLAAGPVPARDHGLGLPPRGHGGRAGRGLAARRHRGHLPARARRARAHRAVRRHGRVAARVRHRPSALDRRRSRRRGRSRGGEPARPRRRSRACATS